MFGEEGGEDGLDSRFIERGHETIGATIMGRNMFGPIRGPWGASDWTGWWGNDPPFHHPVFVLTHFPQPPIVMEGGTTFHFIDGGFEVALERALGAAEGADVLVGGGAATIREFLAAHLIDEMHLVIAPILLGKGERLLEDLDLGVDEFECVELVSSPLATHVRLSKVATNAPH
jgi:dihydrofolate reductase